MRNPPQITEMILAKLPGRGEQEGQKLQYPVPPLLVFVARVKHNRPMPFPPYSICGKKHCVHLSSNASSFAYRTRRRGTAYFLKCARQKQAHGYTCCCCEKRSVCAERDTMVWKTISPKTRGSSPEQRESSARCKSREQNGSLHWLWTTVCCPAALWSQFINIRLETNPKWADCTLTGSHTPDAGGEMWQREGEKNTSNTAKKATADTLVTTQTRDGTLMCLNPYYSVIVHFLVTFLSFKIQLGMMTKNVHQSEDNLLNNYWLQ